MRDPFGQVLTALRGVLREGTAPGHHLPIADVASDLGFSTSPVREALSRLCGEGLIDDRPGLGYFTRTLAAEDIAGLFEVERIHVQLALEITAAEPPGPNDLCRFEVWSSSLVEACDSAPLSESFERIVARLAPVRRLEAEVGLDRLSDQSEIGLSDYYGRRILAARAFAAALRRITPGEYSLNRV